MLLSVVVREEGADVTAAATYIDWLVKVRSRWFVHFVFSIFALCKNEPSDVVLKVYALLVAEETFLQ